MTLHSIMKYPCTMCGRRFSVESRLNQHLRSTGHTRHIERHQKVEDVATQFRCCDCNRDFATELALTQHLRDKIHKPKCLRKKFPCGLCKKTFKDKQASKAHKASHAHKPPCAPHSCIGSNGCGRDFVSPSSMILHLEGGCCPSGLNRSKLNAIITQQDLGHLITSPAALDRTESAAESCDSSEYGGAILSPSSNSFSMIQSNKSWGSFSTSWEFLTPADSLLSLSLDGGLDPLRDNEQDVSRVPCSRLFVCPLCPPNSNRFRSALDLAKHSNSPAHAPKIFHCPVALSPCKKKKSTGKAFSTLSGLAMHVESGACGKNMLFEVIHFVNERLRNIGIREIHLIK